MRIGIGLSIGRFRPSVLTAALIFRAPLQTNILTTRGPGTTTYTHASTATVVEFEGVERTVKSGEARMQEWRRVENLYANSTTLVTQSNTVVAGVYLVQFRGTGSVTLSGAGTGTITGTGANNLAWALVTTTAGTLTSTVSGSCTSGQLENVTGQSIQTPAEYISTGVLSYPFHGTAVDGVKYFETRLDGTIIPKTATSGYLNEPQRTNGVRNNSMVGAVAGTPGTIPTNWTASGNNGLSWSVAGVGSEGSMPYIDLRLSGTASTTSVNTMLFEATNIIAATVGQVFAVSQFTKIVAGTVANLVTVKLVVGQSNTGSGIQAEPGIVNITTPSSLITSAPLSTCRQQISTAMAASSAYLVPYFQVETSAGAVDVTFRIGGSQAEQAASASSLILTTTASAVRAADSLAMPVSVAVGPVNRLFWCSDYTQSSWTKQSGAMSVTGTGKLDPLGTFTAQEVTWTGFGSLYQSQANFIGEQQTGVIWIKGTAGQAISVWFDQPSGLSSRTRITLTGSWQLFTCVTPAADTTSVGSNFAIRRDSASDTATVVNLWRSGGFIGNVTPAEIPLTTTAPNANSQGTMVVTLSASGADAAGRYPGVSLRSVSGTDAMDLYVDSALGMGLRIRSNGSIVLNQYVGSLLANTAYRIAVSWNNGRIAYSVNGGAVTVLTGITMPLALALFKTVADTEWFGTINTPTVYSQALSDATLRALTT